MNAKKPDSPKDRLKAIPLWQWGVITILAGMLSNMVLGMAGSGGGSSAQQRAEALGRATATGLCVVAGIVLIVMHFVRSRK